MSNKGFLDNMFEGMESIVGGLEKSKELSEPYPEEKDIIDAEYHEPRKSVIWGVDKETSTHHLFEDFNTTALCSRHFDSGQLSNRKTELDDGAFKCCGGCLRHLQNRYQRG